MDKQPIRWHRLGLSVAGSFAISALTLAGAAAPAAAAPRMSDVLSQANGYVGVSEVAHSDGTVTDTYRDPAGAEVRVSGPRGMVIDIGPTVKIQATNGKVLHSQSVAARPPALDKSSPGAADRAIAAYEAAGRSVINDAIHNGLDPALARQLDGGLGASSGTQAAAAAETRLVGANATASGTIIYSWCADTKSSDGYVHGHACDVQKMDQDQGGGNWYVADEQTSSGWSTDTRWFPDRLNKLAQWVSYPGGNQVVTWRPNGTQNVGQCVTVTESFSSPQTGLGYSISTNVCPDSIGAYTITNTQFGSRWQGYETDANVYEGSDAVDLVHSPPTASDSPYLHVQIWW